MRGAGFSAFWEREGEGINYHMQRPFELKDKMRYSANILTTLVMLAGLLASGCGRPSSSSDAVSESKQASSQDENGTQWRPKWVTMSDKIKKEKSVLNPTASFLDPGFGGSPVPRNEHEKKKEMKNQEDFVHSFEKARECFGITLKLKNPADTDFGLQIFNDIDGRTGKSQWILYRMDTVQVRSYGEATGAGTPMGTDGMVKSVCSSIHDTVSLQGGRVELE
jgi:hypothetical protein